MHKQVLYFSVWPEHRKQFRDFAEDKGRQYDFCVVEDGNFSCASDLLLYLDKYGSDTSKLNLGRLYIIIDYLPFFYQEQYNYEKEAETIARIILGYPEVYFLFDESYFNSGKSYFLLFLFSGKMQFLSKEVIKEYHIFNNQQDDAFLSLINQRSNLFDGSNLRYATRRYIHSVLKVNRYNFSLLQKSRRDNLSLCIEEEHSQNRFNSYALYANGFRVLPVETAGELFFLNTGYSLNTASKKDNENKNFFERNKYISPKIIVRDYDLQFPDAIGSDKSVTINDKDFKINVVDFIRGVKFWDSEFYTGDSCPEEYANKWYIPQTSDKGYAFWTNLQDVPTFFVSKGVNGIKFCMTRTKFLKKLGIGKEQEKTFQDKQEIQYVRGIRKPVSGIYSPFHFFETVRNRYLSFEISDLTTFIIRDADNILQKISEKSENKILVFRYLVDKYHLKFYQWSYWRLKFSLWKRRGCDASIKKEIDKQFWKDILKEQSWVIDTSRENHDHGVPLDIYDSVQSMLHRAKLYYNVGKYIRAAIISSETIELLNGFHEALTLQAYHILAISENAIAMNAVGGSELALKEDTLFRINKIENEIERILNRSRSEGQTKAERRELKYNVLNQIFSNCREFCKKKEYFGAENCFISAMAHVNEGFASSDIWHEIEAICKRITDSWGLKKDTCQ